MCGDCSAADCGVCAVGSTITAAVDIWALGCTMFCLAYGYSPFEPPKEGLSKLAILNGKYSIPAGGKYSARFIQMVQMMLQLDAAARPSVEDVIGMCRVLMRQS